MGQFLRENWLWIVVPIVLVLGGLFAFVFFGGSGDAVNPFDYPVF